MMNGSAVEKFERSKPNDKALKPFLSPLTLNV